MRIELQTSIKWWKGGFGGTRENRRQYVWRLGPPQPTKMSAFVLSDHFTAFTLPSAHTVPSNLFFPCLDKLALLGLAPYPPPLPFLSNFMRPAIAFRSFRVAFVLPYASTTKLGNSKRSRGVWVSAFHLISAPWLCARSRKHQWIWSHCLRWLYWTLSHCCGTWKLFHPKALLMWRSRGRHLLYSRRRFSYFLCLS